MYISYRFIMYYFIFGLFASFINHLAARPIYQASPYLVLVPPQVVLQHNQTEININCSVLTDQKPTTIQWIIIGSHHRSNL